MITVRAATVEALHALAAEIAGRVRQALADGVLEHVLIGLEGPLGAGKTEWVRGFMAGLDPQRADDVCSPTYAIVQIYRGTPEVRHLDLYRLGSLEDLEAIGYREHFFGDGVALVEWIDNVPDAVPEQWVHIALAVEPTDVREIRIFPHGVALARLMDGIGN